MGVFIKVKRLFELRAPTQAFIVVFCLTFFSMDTLLFGTNISRKWQFGLVGALIIYEVILLIIRFYKERRKLCFNEKSVRLTLGLMIFVIGSQISAAFRDSYNLEIQYFYHMLLFVVILTSVHVVTEKEYIHEYTNVMSIFAIVAIILFLLEKMGIAYSLPSFRVVNKSGYLYFHFGLGAVPAPREYVPIRAYGIFREPAVFAIHLCVALYFELFKKKTDICKVGIFMVAVFLTYSTAGYLVLGGFLVIYVFMKKTKTQTEQVGKVLIILGGIILLFFVMNEDLQNKVFGKLFTENNSLNSRVYSVIGGLTYSIQYPFMGHGWNDVVNHFAEFIFSEYTLSDIASTNTYVRMACIYGWIFTITTLYGLWRFQRKLENNMLLVVALFVCWIVLFSNGDLVLNPIAYILAYYGIDNSLERLG